MRKSVLIGLGVMLALAAALGFVARQKQSGSHVQVVRPAAETGAPSRSLRQGPWSGDQRPSRGTEPQVARRWERDGRSSSQPGVIQPGKPQIGGWQAVQLVLDALNAFVGIIGIGLALMGMRMQRLAAPAGLSQRAAIHTPDTIRANPAA